MPRLLLLAGLLCACASPDDTDTDAAPVDDTGTAPAQELPPTSGADLQPWLDDGSYADWKAESATHTSTGPHFGEVRVFVNDVLFASLEAGATEHPEGSAAIKELWGSGAAIGGYSVTVKVDPDGQGGDGWYWFESYDGTDYADGVGVGLCTGCHSAGSDTVLTPFPLQ